MKSLKNTLSLVTPCKDQVAFLSENIEHLHAFAPNAEHVIVDGASTDGSVAFIKSAAKKFAHLTYSSEPDTGMYDALLRGFHSCSGDILGYINCDDFIFPWTTDVVLKTFHEHPEVDFLIGDCVEVYGEKWAGVVNPSIRHSLRFLRGRGFLSQPSVFFRRSLYEKVGKINNALHLVGDSDLWLRFLKSGAKGMRIKEVLSGMRQVDGRLTDIFSHKIQKEMSDVLRTHHEVTQRQDVFFQKISTRLLHRHFIFSALLFLRTGHSQYWSKLFNSGILHLDKNALEHALFHSSQGSTYATLSQYGQQIFPFCSPASQKKL